MTIEPQLTPEVLAQNIREFEAQGASLDEVRVNFLEQGGSVELWEHAIEMIAAEKMLDQVVPPPPPRPSRAGHSRRWILIGVLVLLAASAGWWAWIGLQKNSFDELVDRVQQFVSSAEEESVVIPPVVPFDDPVVEKVEEKEVAPVPSGVKRRPRPSGS